MDTDKIYTVIMDMVRDLGEKGLLRDTPDNSYKHQRILSRFLDAGRMLGAVKVIQSDLPTYREFRASSSRWIDETDWTDMTIYLVLYHMVQSYELIAKIFVWMLDADRLALKQHPTIFNILDRLERDVECGGFRKLLNNGLRNALAHGDYWIDQGESDWHLVYEGARHGRITFDELADESNRIQHVVTGLHLWYRSWLSNDPSMRDPTDRSRPDADSVCG